MTLKAFLYLIVNFHIGIGTNFSPNDIYNPQPELACRPGHDLNYIDLVVAHKKLPCGSKIFLYNFRNKRYTLATVLDRGPKHASIDLGPAVTKALRSNGEELVFYIKIQ